MRATGQFAPWWTRYHLRVASLAQPPRQREQGLLSSPEVRPGVDVDD